MLRAAGRNCAVIMGRGRVGRRWRRWRGSAKIHEPDRLLHQDGKMHGRVYMALLTRPQIEALPTRSDSEPPLQNVLSISTAGRNRYLLHFNSHHSLIQWTASIRLAMFEHATLQEAYTGALIAGKGKALNNINLIMDRTRMKTEDWARVRFGAGTPWRRCWCVITPPDEKEVQRVQKQFNKKRSAYDRSRPPVFKGDIKFYDSKKTKKVLPIATITDAYSAFAIYPQAKPLIDASTLVKVEGSITIHSDLPSKSEGFVFVMPEAHPAVSGFEIMLRWLFPVFDTFALYGRPGRLIADTGDPQSLMFAMPKRRRYGYLETLDVAGLILERGSAEWRESDWRRRMKDLTSKRMTTVESSSGSQASSRYSSRRNTRNSFGPSHTRIHFDDSASIRSTPIGREPSPQADSDLPRTDSAPPSAADPQQPASAHYRSVSETQVLDRFANAARNDGAYDQGPPPPLHSLGIAPARYTNEMGSTPERVSSEDDAAAAETRAQVLDNMRGVASPEPVVPPPAFSHSPGTLPTSKPWHSPELRRANSRMSHGTLSQMVGAAGASGAAAAAAYQNSVERSRAEEEQGTQSPAQGRYAFSPASSTISPEPLAPRPPAHLMSSSQPPPQYSPSPAFPSPNILAAQAAQAAQSKSASPVPGGTPRQSGSAQTTPITAALARLQTSPNVSRKPLPPNSSIIQTPTSAQTQSSNDSFGGHVIDEAAFNMIASPLERTSTFAGNAPRRSDTDASVYPEDTLARRKNEPVPPLPPIPQRSDTDASMYPEDIRARRKNEPLPPVPPMPDSRYRTETATSVYPEDTNRRQTLESSPPMPSMPGSFDIRDWSNTDESRYEDEMDRRRTGVLRTVGNVEGVQNGVGNKTPNPLIPTVDFGPTYNFASGTGPRQQSPGRGRGVSPGPAQTRRPDQSPAYRSPVPQSHSQSPNRNSRAPDSPHYRNESGGSRTVPWQPGMGAAGLGSPNTALTAEEFVQQRAAVVPLYAHQRQNSGNVLSRNTPTPPLGGPQGQSHRNSVDLLQRPRSRDASTTLTQKQLNAQYQQYPEQMSDYRAPQPQYGNMPYANPALKLQPGAQAPGQNNNMPPPSPLYSPPPPQFFTTPQFLSQKNEHPNA